MHIIIIILANEIASKPFLYACSSRKCYFYVVYAIFFALYTAIYAKGIMHLLIINYSRSTTSSSNVRDMKNTLGYNLIVSFTHLSKYVISCNAAIVSFPPFASITAFTSFLTRSCHHNTDFDWHSYNLANRCNWHLKRKHSSVHTILYVKEFYSTMRLTTDEIHRI